MKPFRAAVFIVAVLILTGCATTGSVTNQLRLGMEEDQIQRVFNQPPSRTVARDGVVRKFYGNILSGWTYVDFEEGKAIGWGIRSLLEETEGARNTIKAELNSTVEVVD